MRLRRGAAVVLSFATVVGLAGCSILLPPPIPEPVDLLCTWEQEEFGATVTLEIDGELTYSNLPLGLLGFTPPGDPIEETTRLTGEGRWQLGDGFHLRNGGNPVVGILTDDYASWLYVHGSGEDLWLYAQPDVDHSKYYPFTKHDCAADMEYEVRS